MKPCDCQSRRDCFHIHPDEVEDFFDGFVQLTNDRMEEYHLYRCHACTTFWIVDEGSRGPMAVRAFSETGISGFDERPFRRELLIEMHGGLSDKECMFVDCTQRAMRGGAFCVDHVYPQYAIPGKVE